MSASLHDLPLPLLPPHRQWNQPHQPVQTLHSANAPSHIVFTRQLWQRTMSGGSHPANDAVLNQSQAQDTRGSSHNITTGSSRRTSSSVSSRSRRRSSSPSGRDPTKTPLTPEESPPFSRTTRKRTAGIVEAEDKDLTLPNAYSAHPTCDGGEVHVCICQPEPKIPRPRNGASSRARMLSLTRVANVLYSLHPVSPEPTGPSRRSKSRSREPGDFQNHRRAVAEPSSRGQSKVESAC